MILPVFHFNKIGKNARVEIIIYSKTAVDSITGFF